MTKRRVVITGVGMATALGVGRETYWQSIHNNECGVRRIQGFDPSGFPCQIGGEVGELEMRDIVPKSFRKAVKLMSRDIALAVVAADAAVRDAHLKTKCTAPDDPPDVDPTRSGVNIGAGLICCDLAELAAAAANAVENGKFSYEKWGREGMQTLTPLWLLKYLPNMLGCHVSIIHDLQGVNNNITCSEVSGLLSIGEACRVIQRGDADLMVAGGAECKANPMGLMRQTLLNRVNTDSNDAPENACRPFDADANGTVVAEGAGIVVLEELDTARRRNATIYGEIVGWGASNCFTPGFDAPQPEGRGLTIAIGKALREAGLIAADLDLIMARGTGVVYDDRAEVAGIADALGEHVGSVPVIAVTSRVGNCGAGATAVDFVSAMLALQEGFAPPVHNCRRPHPDYPLDFVREAPRTGDFRHAVVCGSTYGGQTAALAVRRNLA